MWMDIAILVIVLGSTVLGYNQGFMRTFLHTVGWLLAIVLSFAWYPAVVEFLKDKTDFYTTMHTSITEQLAAGAGDAAADSAGTAFGRIPDILVQAFQAASDAVADSVAGSITDLLFNIVGFLIVIAAIKFIFWLLISLFSKKDNDGITGWFDGIFGAVFGGVKGIVVVFILLAILVPVTELSSGTFFLDSLHESKIAESLYDNNAVFIMVKEFL
ncbi:CvpA family protein [Bacilliculturomica massiliensis]|uniref:CvpA family protein n=1 Tax=Bacilliculturomica massiliensis TaxID=1917867 RepID=UPI001032238D|nr:CvpA family protein [Bacilliculturomica massiliensis]